jgi:D-3-phosphoglycerate dehydrogenase / 2-oxoglutarate reductase
MQKRLLLNVPLDLEARTRLAEHCEIVGPLNGNIAATLDKYAPIDGIIASAVISMDGAAMDRLPDLQCVGRLGIGYDNIDVDAANDRGILVINTPDAPAQSTAEHAVSFIFALAKRTVAYDSMVRSGRWNERLNEPGCELAGKTLGIIGIGRVGRRTAQMCAGLQMNIISYDPFVSPKDCPANIELVADLKSLLQKSDFISLHLPLIKSTYHLIGAAEFDAMKPGAFLINVARGGLVDSSALAEALQSHKIAGAAVDVYEPEPPTAADPIMTLPNLILSPHIAWATREGSRRMYEMLVNDMLDALSGKCPAHLVNPTIWEHSRILSIKSNLESVE